MKPTVLLRVASILTFIHAVLHTIGGVFGKPAPGVASQVAAAMAANRFPVLGEVRSYADFYRGLGLGCTISLTVEAIVFWLLSNVARCDPERLRPVLLAFTAGYLAMAVNSHIYFFMAPVVVEIIIAGCLLGAAFTARRPAGVTAGQPLAS